MGPLPLSKEGFLANKTELALYLATVIATSPLRDPMPPLVLQETTIQYETIGTRPQHVQASIQGG